MNKPIEPEHLARFPAVNPAYERCHTSITDNAEAYAADIADHSDALETLSEILRIYHSHEKSKAERVQEIAEKLDDLTDNYARHQAEKEAG